MLITQDEMIDMIKRQEVLNKKYNGEDWRAAMTMGQIKFATLAEVGEFLTEIEDKWRWWKFNKNSNRQKAIFEFIDIVHFTMLGLLHKNHDINILEKAVKFRFDWMDKIGMTYQKPTDADDLADCFCNAMARYFEQGLSYGSINSCASYAYDVMESGAELLGLGPGELYKAYLLKNEQNHKRVEGGLLEGKYDKTQEEELKL